MTEYARDTGRHAPFDVAVPIKTVAQLLEFAGWTDLSTDAVLKLMEDREFRELILDQMCKSLENYVVSYEPQDAASDLADVMDRLGMGPSAVDDDPDPSDSELEESDEDYEGADVFDDDELDEIEYGPDVEWPDDRLEERDE